MIYMFICMFVHVLYPKNLLHFVVAVSLVYGLRDVDNAFYDAEINAKLVGQARLRIEGHVSGLQHSIRNSFILYFTSVPLL